jgi:hypothetical protein
VVPVAPVVPAPAPEAELPAPEPEVRHPVTTTVCPWLRLPLVLPDCPCDPLVDCAAAPAPSATAIIVPKRNCRFITSSVLGENKVPLYAARSSLVIANAGPHRMARVRWANPQAGIS